MSVKGVYKHAEIHFWDHNPTLSWNHKIPHSGGDP